MTSQLEMDNLLDFFNSVLTQSEELFERSITKFVTQRLLDKTEVLYKLLKEPTRDKDLHFAIFFALATILRRNKEISKFKELDKEYGANFAEMPMYYHIKSLLYRQTRDKHNIDIAFENAEKAVELLPNHPGVLHSFAEIVAIYFEFDLEAEKDQQLIKKAIKSVDSALAVREDYGKFSCTKGRLLALQHKFSEAQQEVLKAIDKEDSNEKDYAIRISDYTYYLSAIERQQLSELSNKKLDELASKSTAFKKEIDEQSEQIKSLIDVIRTQNILFLGFFAATIGFTLSSIQIATKHSFHEAGLIIIILFGAQISAFSAFFLMLPDNRKSYKVTIAVGIMGIILILLAFILERWI